ncbi:hypothetical protein BT96DRAFT_973067 [Gymnopus androsaceus JB14]|uniref:Crinkler (CRN) family protein n=1 Tax=Gymnopus androsaceus JB14 TaxID=1447944 RepID=A0A6A4I736_9AGAR|nr:hypothetical protein BT96DRAFT_973067 [Gymnopus androsaceus JB14]
MNPNKWCTPLRKPPGFANLPSVEVPSLDKLTDEGHPITTDFTAEFLRVAKDSAIAPYTMLVHYFDQSGLRRGDISGGCIVLGHPGIGMSVFFWYILIKRVIRGLNTYVRTTDGFYCYSGYGFEHFTTQSEFESYLVGTLFDETGILLFDTNENIAPPKVEGGDCWPVIISSRKFDNLKQWQKQTQAECIWMKACTWEEIYSACYTLHPVNHERLPEIYALCGPSLRFTVDAITSPSVDHYVSRRSREIDDALCSLKQDGAEKLGAAFRAIKNLTPSNDYDISSLIFLLQPEEEENRYMPFLDTITVELSDRVLDAIEEASAEQQAAFSTLFPPTAAKGNLFEALYTRRLRRVLIDEKITTIRARLLSPGHPEKSYSLTIPSSTTVYTFDNLADVTGALTSDDVFVLIPKKRYQAMWDFAVRVGNTMNMFQATTQPKMYCTLAAGLIEMKEFTSGHGGLSDVNAWRLIFIVPLAVEPSWTKSMEIKKGSGKKAEKLDTSVYTHMKQYVAGMDFTD